MLLAKLCKAIMSAGYQSCLGCGKRLEDCNDCPAGTSDHLDKDLLHKAINAVMAEDHIEVKREANGPEFYDPNVGDELECQCGHEYYRHFDTYDMMRPVGCKYCHCQDFRPV